MNTQRLTTAWDWEELMATPFLVFMVTSGIGSGNT